MPIWSGSTFLSSLPPPPYFRAVSLFPPLLPVLTCFAVYALSAPAVTTAVVIAGGAAAALPVLVVALTLVPVLISAARTYGPSGYY
jgi:hypothetical protein